MRNRYIFGIAVLVFLFFGVVSAAAVDTEALKQLADIKTSMANAMDHEDYAEALKISLEVEDIGIDPAELFAGEYKDASGEVKRGRDDYLWVYWRQGWIYNAVYNDLANAVKGYEIVYRYHHNPSYSVFTTYEEVLRKIGEKNKAKQVLKNGLTRLPESDYPNIYWNLGWYYYLDGEYGETVRCGEKSYLIDPNLAGPIFNAATALFAMGKNEEALGWFGLGLFGTVETGWKNSGMVPNIITDLEEAEARYPKNNGIKTALSVLYLIERKEEEVKSRLPVLLKEDPLLPHLLRYITYEQSPQFYWPLVQYAAMVGEKTLTDELLSLLFSGVKSKYDLAVWIDRIEANSVVVELIRIEDKSPFTVEWIIMMETVIEEFWEGYRKDTHVSAGSSSSSRMRAFKETGYYYAGWYSLNLKQEIKFYVNRGEYDKAEPLYDKLLAIHKDFTPKGETRAYAKSLDNLADLYAAMGRYEEAVPVYEKAITILKELPPKEKHPDYVQSLNKLAKVYETTGKQTEADQLSKRIDSIKKMLPSPGKHPEEYKKEIVDIHDKMEKAFGSKDYGKAAELSFDFDKLHINLPAVFTSGKTDDDTLELERQVSNIIYYQARLHQDIGYMKIAAEKYRFLYENVKNLSPAVYNLFADTLWKLGNKEKAFSILWEGLEWLPENSRNSIYKYLAGYHYQEKEYKLVMECAEACYRQSLSEAVPFFYAGLVNFAAGKNDEGISWIGLGLIASFGKGYNNGVVERDWIIAMLESLLIEDPDNSGIKTALAVLHSSQNRVEKGKEYLSDAKETASLLSRIFVSSYVAEPLEAILAVLQCAVYAGSSELTNRFISLYFQRLYSFNHWLGVNKIEEWVSKILHMQNIENAASDDILSSISSKEFPFMLYKAVELFDKAHEVFKNSGRVRYLKPRQSMIGNPNDRIDSIKESIELYNECLKLFGNIGPAADYWIGLTHYELALLNSYIGNTNNCNYHFGEARLLFETIPPEGQSYEYSALFFNIAEILVEKKNYIEAKNLYKIAFNIVGMRPSGNISGLAFRIREALRVLRINMAQEDTVSKQYYELMERQKDASPKERDAYKELIPAMDMFTEVPAGSYKMGDTHKYFRQDEDEVLHRVDITNSFLIGRYEVTQKEFSTIMGYNPSYFKGDFRPVECVSWYDAVTFCNRKSEQEGLEPCYTFLEGEVVCDFNANGYRLPTEAEWEYAAGNGVDNRKYFFDIDKYQRWSFPGSFKEISSATMRKTLPVGEFLPTYFGLYDVYNNVREWCWDWYGSYPNGDASDPAGPEDGEKRVVRGAGWSSHQDNRDIISNRFSFNPAARNRVIGFRIVRRK
jgi:formylglycine-generating enzyme required for sulfatase activity